MGILRAIEAADEILRKEARERLAERLKAGEKVGNLDFHDLLDSELNQQGTYALVFSELSALLLTTDNQYANELREKIVDGVIERYLTNPRFEYLVDEEAGDAEADPFYEDAREVGMA